MAVELATAYVSVIPTVKGIDKAARDSAKGVGKGIDQELDKGLQGVGQKHGSRIGSAISSAAAKAAKVGAAAVGIAVGASLVGGFKSAIGQENTEKTLGGLYDSTAKAGDMMERIRRIAKQSPIEFEAYSKGATAIAYMGIEGEKSEKILRNIGAAITTAGGGGEEMGRATDAMTKMVNAGKVELDTLNMLSEAGVPIFSGLSAHFGKSMAEVREMVTAGKVGLEDVLSVTEKATGPIFKQMQKASKATATSFSNQWKIAKDNVLVAIGDRMRPAIESLGPVVGKVGTRVAELISGDGGGKTPAWVTSIKEGVGTLKAQAGQVFTNDVLPHLKRFWSDMKGVFADVKPFADSVGSFLSDAFKAFQPYLETAAKLLGGAFMLALRAIPPVLSGVMKALGWVLDKLRPLLPLVAAVVSAFVAYKTTLLIINGVQKVAAAVTTAYHAVMSAGPAIMYAVGAAQRFYTATVNGGTGAVKARTVAEKIGMAVGKAQIVVTKGMAIAQRALNAVLRANPIGLVITGLLLLGAGLVLAYKKSETFRRVVDKAWASVKNAAKVAVDWFQTVAWPVLKSVFTGIGSAAMWLWNKGIKPVTSRIMAVFRSVATVATWLWKVVLGVAIVAIWGLFKTLGRVAMWLWNKAIRPAFNAIGKAGKWLWNAALKPAFTWIKNGAKDVFGWIKNTGWPWVRGAFNAIKAKASWLWEKMKWPFGKIKGGMQSLANKTKWLRDWIKRYFDAVKRNADWLWNKVKVSFDKLKAGVNSVKTAFGKAKDGIGRAWSKVYDKVTSPIKKAIRWLNKHFIGKLNTMLGNIPGVKLRIDPISTKGFDTGGYTGPGHYLKPAGIVHAGEMVIKKDSTNKLRKRIGMSGLNYMNQHGELPPQMGAYAKGGIVELGKRLQREGYHVSEHPAFGGVVPGAHSANGYHYKGGALDINADFWNSRFRNEMQALDRLNATLRSEGWNTIWRAPNHWDHLHVDIANGQGGGGGGGFSGWMKKFLPDWVTSLIDDPLGYVKGKVSGFMDRMPGEGKFGLAGAVLPDLAKKMASGIGNKVKDTFDLSSLLDKYLPGWLSGGDKGGGGGNPATRAAVRDAASRYGWGSGAQWQALDWLIGKESSWNVNAANPTSSARGLFQKMTSIHGPVEGTAAGQARWGLNYIKGRYGSPLGAKAFWQRNNWYDKGGLAKPLEFDRGGYLPTGYSTVVNNTGKPEPLKRMDLNNELPTIYVQNPWTGEYHEAKMREVAREEGDFKDSLNRMYI